MILIGVRINDGLSPHQEYTRNNFPSTVLTNPCAFSAASDFGHRSKVASTQLEMPSHIKQAHHPIVIS